MSNISEELKELFARHELAVGMDIYSVIKEAEFRVARAIEREFESLVKRLQALTEAEDECAYEILEDNPDLQEEFDLFNDDFIQGVLVWETCEAFIGRMVLSVGGYRFWGYTVNDKYVGTVGTPYSNESIHVIVDREYIDELYEIIHGVEIVHSVEDLVPVNHSTVEIGRFH